MIDACDDSVCTYPHNNTFPAWLVAAYRIYEDVTDSSASSYI